ncbi:dipeptidase [Sphingomonas sp. LaA6.9]|uniref:dipeptidase n=1 Tax=Sphingomonas sp. LaA6.9 TaxID=2919914 RepID=UPI001F4FDDD8|nr:membrane dipeptidase [Sphingomonas sp. LaA6.9]MCJ8158458.1 dipeptidase [Sphingomonas sp. LaA6.9]
MSKMPGASRRAILKGALTAAAIGGFPMINTGAYQLFAQSSRRYSKRAVDLVRQSLVIDMLAPLKIDFRPEYYASPLSEKDAADFRASGITGFHNAVGTGGPEARAETLAWIAAWQGFAGRNAHVFSLVGRAEDLDRAKREGKCAVIMGVQNSEHFRTVEDVKMFYQIGQRCSQLTYNSQNMIGSGSTDRIDGGVSDYGAAIIKAMNEVGMLIDVSHCGDRTTLDAIEMSPKPIAITHSNCRALVDHPRVKTDEAIKALGAKGGVMGITGVRMFVSAKEPTALANIVDHIDHVVKLAGIDHVGIGSDADLNGYDDMPADQYAQLKAGYKASYAFRDKIDTDGFDHPKKVYDLTEELIRRSYSNENIAAILGGNFRRLLGATWI